MMCGAIVTNGDLNEQANGHKPELDPAACLQEIDEITKLRSQLAHARAARDIYHKNAQAASRELGKLEQAYSELQLAHDQLAEENLALSRHNLEMAAKIEKAIMAAETGAGYAADRLNDVETILTQEWTDETVDMAVKHYVYHTHPPKSPAAKVTEQLKSFSNDEKLKDYEKLQERHKRVHEQAAWLSEEREQLTQENGKLHRKIAELEDDLEASSEGYETMRQHVEQRLLSIQLGLRSLAGASVASWLAGGLAVLDVLIDQTKHDLSGNATYRTTKG
jgi:predicted  nucleic acid-binding Zn-ribbon protein